MKRFSIRVVRDTTTVWVGLVTGLECDEETFWFSHKFNSENIACVVEDYLQTRLDEQIKGVREQEYKEGYREGRSKKAKKKWFWQTLHIK